MQAANWETLADDSKASAEDAAKATSATRDGKIVSSTAAGLTFSESTVKFSESIAVHPDTKFRPHEAVQAVPAVRPATPVPAIFHATTPTQAAVELRNRAYLQIMRPDSGSESAIYEPSLRFDAFVITSTNLVDAEKMDVVETFGRPHFFASGQFTKKLAVSGLVRSEARKPGATSNARLDVSDYVMFRNFYEQHLRATKMAEIGGYVRLFVDGDYYDGYIQNLQFSRSSDMEALAPWTMQFVLFRHWNAKDKTAQTLLRAQIGDLGRAPRALSDRVALAELEDALGKCELFVGPFTDNQLPSTTSYKVASPLILSENAVKSGEQKATERCGLVAKGTRQTMECTPEEAFRGAVELVFEDKVDERVDGAATPMRQRALKVRVINFSKLRVAWQARNDAYTTLTAKAIPSSGKAPGAPGGPPPAASVATVPVTFRIRTQSRKQATVIYNIGVDGKAALQIPEIIVTAKSTADNSLVATITPSSSTTSVVAGTAVFSDPASLARFVGADGTFVLDLKLTLRDAKGVAVQLEDVEKAIVTPGNASLVATDSVWKPMTRVPDLNVAVQKLTSAVDKTGLTTGALRLTLAGRLPGDWTGPRGPLQFAMGLQCVGELKVELPGFTPVTVKYTVQQKLTSPYLNVFKNPSVRLILPRMPEGLATTGEVYLYFEYTESAKKLYAEGVPFDLLDELSRIGVQCTASNSASVSGSGDTLVGTFSLKLDRTVNGISGPMEIAGPLVRDRVVATLSAADVAYSRRVMKEGVGVSLHFVAKAAADGVSRTREFQGRTLFITRLRILPSVFGNFKGIG